MTTFNQNFFQANRKYTKEMAEAKNDMDFLKYDLQVKEKVGSNAYLERLIAKRKKRIEEILRAYDAIVSSIIDDHSDNPILERYGK